MASGSLGEASPAANTNTTIYTVPAGKVASWNISVFNRGDAAVSVRISKGLATPGNAQFLEFDTVIPPKGVLERTALAASAGDRIVFRGTTGDCSVMVYGYEDDV